MKKLFYSAFLILALVGCKDAVPMVGNPAKTVEVSDDIRTSFFDNVSEYEVIPLEASDEALLSNIMKIRIYKEMIYLLNGYGNLTLKAFDTDGRFVSEISRKGRGPEEYVELRNFEIDPTRDELLLLDGGGQKILIYKLNGDFIREVKIPVYAECVGRLPGGNFVLACVTSQLHSNEYHVVAICDENGNLLERHIENELNQPTISVAANTIMTAMGDGSLSLMPQYHNIVYNISDDGVVAEVGFEFRDNTITIDKFAGLDFNDTWSFLAALEGNNYIAGDHMETDEYIFFYNKGLMELEHVFYNKINGKQLRVRNPLFGTPVFIDDGSFWASINKTMLSSLEGGDDESTKALLATLDACENTPLILYKLKI